jgi:hypothetical protein
MSRIRRWKSRRSTARGGGEERELGEGKRREEGVEGPGEGEGINLEVRKEKKRERRRV